jgi:hypothetical protein
VADVMHLLAELTAAMEVVALLRRIRRDVLREPNSDFLEHCVSCRVNGYSKHRDGCLVAETAKALAKFDAREGEG